jgi:hypothetical protein
MFISAPYCCLSASLGNAQQPDRVAEDRSDSITWQRKRRWAARWPVNFVGIRYSSRTPVFKDTGAGSRWGCEPQAFLFTFILFADDTCEITHEPASLPGGYVFVPASLFVATHNEAEFAGMLAHAMEHVAERQGDFRWRLGRKLFGTYGPPCSPSGNAAK